MVPEDLFALAEDMILHRLRLNYEALADGRTTQAVLQEMLSQMGSEPTMASSNGQATRPAENSHVPSEVVTPEA